MPARTAANMSRSAGCCASAASSRRRSPCRGSSTGCAPIPSAGRALMRENQSYVFFRELTGPGPLGALGRPVTPRASASPPIPRFVPLGAPVLLVGMDNPRANGLWVAQDTGGAIRGANRFDTFWGAGRGGGGDRRRHGGARPGLICCCRAARSRGSGAAMPRRLSAEEQALWRQVVESVRPLARRSAAAGSAAEPARASRAAPRLARQPAPAAAPARKAAPGTTLDGELGPAAVARPGRARPQRRPARPQSRHRLRPARPAARAGDRRRGARLLLLITGKPPRRRRPGSAARSARRSATGSPPRAMPATSPRCATPIRATAARARSTSSSGGSAERRRGSTRA